MKTNNSISRKTNFGDNKKNENLSILKQFRETKRKRLSGDEPVDNQNVFNLQNSNLQNKLELKHYLNIYEISRQKARDEYFAEQKQTEILKQECREMLRSTTTTDELRKQLKQHLDSLDVHFKRYKTTTVKSQQKRTKIINILKRSYYSL